MSERLLRLLYMDAIEHDDLTVSPAKLCEIVSLPDRGVESVRGYYVSTGVRFHTRVRRLRAATVYEWGQLTGERLASDLVPVSTGRKAT